MKFASKASALLAMNPDIAIVQECSKTSAESLHRQGYSQLWFGENEMKGISILYKLPWMLRPLAAPDNKWIIALNVTGPENFTLIAVWAWVKAGGTPSYVKLIRESLAAHKEWFSNGHVVMAGDFNSSCYWDALTDGSHASLVEDLAQYGLVSAYHSHHDEKQGSESKPTYHHLRKRDRPYHIDYIFMPKEWTARMKHFDVGHFNPWATMSDHCPLTIEIL
jgi:endonuclease/exonuclease/phosphatase family metal-dependent hydrolase